MWRTRASGFSHRTNFKKTEIIAKKLNYPLIYLSMKQPKRGYYEITPELLCDNTNGTVEEFRDVAYIYKNKEAKTRALHHERSDNTSKSRQ